MPVFITSFCSDYLEQVKRVNQVSGALEEVSFNLLGSADRYKMPDSLMLNSPYCLTKKGAVIKTHLFV